MMILLLLLFTRVDYARSTSCKMNVEQGF